MDKNSLSIMIVSIVMLAWLSGSSGASHAAPNSTLGAFLGVYVPNAVIANSSYAGASIGSHSYAIMQINSTGTNYIVINTSAQPYAFVLDSSTAEAVLRPYLLGVYYPNQSTVSSLGSYMDTFINQSSGPLNDCLTETGLQAYLCSAGTNRTSCLQNSCQTVPVCTKVLKKFGPASPFADGLVNFSIQYGTLNTSFREYMSLASSLSQNSVGSALPQMGSLASQIDSLSHKIPLNPLFPPPTNMSAQQIISICSNYANNGPWYCYAVGFCASTNSNYTALDNAEGQISYLLSTPISNSSTAAIAIEAVSNANSYYLPIFNATASARFNTELGSTFTAYNSLAENISFVLSRYSNATLSSALANLTAVHDEVIAGGLTQNFTTAQRELSDAVANALIVYNKDGAGFLRVYSAAFNSTALIAIQEFNYKPGAVPFFVANLASKQAAINAKLQGTVNSSYLGAASQQILSLSAQAQAMGAPFSFESMTKALYGGFSSALVYSANTPASAQIAGAPLYSPILPLIVGVIIVLLMYLFTYHRLNVRKKLKLTPSVKRAWLILFFILVAIVILMSALTYIYAAGADSFMPVSSFLSSVRGANTVYLLENTSLLANGSVGQCASSITAALASQKKTVYELNITGYTCTTPTGTSGTTCFNKILASGVPAILLTAGNSTISFKGFYGDTLYASGAALEGSTCLLGNIMRVNR